ncbi:MAG: metallophosphoesterase, partial [Verrucomicrobia bacterium]|nr:metallophosphoesterase [Verrucomicrobiota bacterium]
ENQYQWLQRTLEGSTKKFRFVFIHHLVGGADEQSRGGSEAAPFYEWGGKDSDGGAGFQQNRPGWPAPIHSLLANNKVSIVFHGHDHFYAKQELDGIIYQEVPQPGCPGNGKPPRSAADYGYKAGVILGGSGHLRVTVAAATTTVEYIRADPAATNADARVPGAVAHGYRIGAPSGPQQDERRESDHPP